MKAVVFTLGCKVNECESDGLIAGLIEKGYEVIDKLVKADLYIVNTCAVTKEAEKKSRQMVSRIKKLNKNAKIIFTGCACEKDPTSFIEKDENFLVTGTFSKTKILEMLDERGVQISPQSLEYEEFLPVKSLRTRTYVKVQDGCNNFCSYCIIPYLRGRTRSRNPKSVIDEIKLISPKEVVINGINLSAYNYNGITLTGLMRKLTDLDVRIRLGSLEVNVIDDEFLTALSNLKDFAEHFHLSLQSGSNDVLKKMNRHYTREEFIDKVNLIRKYFPNAGITTDVIVGFPTETEEDFNQTLDLIKIVQFSDVHAFTFSPRSGTAAYKMPDLDAKIKKDRLDRLLKLKFELKNQFAQKMMGKEERFLFEEVVDGYKEGYTGNYLRMYVLGTGKEDGIERVRIVKPFKDGVLAEIIK